MGVKGLINWFEVLKAELIASLRHQHTWRPAECYLLRPRPAKQCDCGHWKTITEAEFYALFGKHFMELSTNLKRA
jgi:hypothetical protein